MGLVLARKKGQSIFINQDNIKIKILDFYYCANKQHVRLYIEAPENISIHREEIYERIYHDVKNNKK